MSVLIDIFSLTHGVQTFDLSPVAEDLDLDPEVFSSIHVGVEIDAGEQRISLKMTARAVALLTCDRTLVDYDQQIEGDFHVLFERSFGRDADLEGDETLRKISSSEQTIDIAPDVRDTLLLAIPLRKVAPEADGIEIPLAFGTPTEEAVDPRWKALEALRSKE